MKALILMLAVIMLTACGATAPVAPEARTLVKVERIVTPIPRELLEIPDPVPNLAPEVLKSDDKAVARWLLDSEERTLALELKIRQIRELYIKYLKDAKAANAKESSN
jgi:hypothetical protein